ncbi:MAG: class I SAM-dependent methyltransferase [Myxococcota bacterium]
MTTPAAPRLLMYGELVPWYRLIDPPADHAAEAAAYADALAGAIEPPPNAADASPSLLELGAGAGHNALHLKERFRCTLADVSEPMLGLSRALNPECEHVHGDMRTLRLGRTFDAVLVHDAVMYMTTLDDLRAAAATAFAHTRPGGAALFAPDVVRESFAEATVLLAEDDGARSLRGIQWTWDPDPSDDTCVVEYAFLLRDRGADGGPGERVEAVRDRHVEELVRATWVDVLSAVGYRVEGVARPLDDGRSDEVFLCRRPATRTSTG